MDASSKEEDERGNWKFYRVQSCAQNKMYSLLPQQMYSLSLAPETVIETHKNSSHDNILPKIDPVDFFLFLSHPI